MKYLSLFSGIGGFELGIKQAYESNRNWGNSKESGVDEGITASTKSNEWLRESPTCIGFSEIDKYAASIYQRHFPNHKNYGDITKIDEKQLPDFDLMVGGFPCQSFSIAGKRGGFNDTRGTMFFEIARIVREKQPRLLLLENVKGLLSHDKGKTFTTIISTLDELGYDCQWQVLNSKNHGVPQNRERVFIIGHLRGTSRPEVFPFGEADGETHVVSDKNQLLKWSKSRGMDNGKKREEERLLKSGTSQTLSTGEGCGNFSSKNYIKQLNQPTHSNDRVYGTDGVSPTLNTMQGGNRQPFISQINPSKESGGKQPYQQNRVYDKDGLSPTLDGKAGVWNVNTSKIRRLTPTECERLQGFPESERNVIIEVCKQVNANGAETTLNIKGIDQDSAVQVDVLIDCVENGVEIHSQGRLLLNAKGAEKKNWCHPHISIDDFVQMLVGIDIIKEKITKRGEVESHLNEQCLTHQKSGLRLGNLSGKEIMLPVGDVKSDSTILKELLKYTTLNHSDTENLEQKLTTLSSFVIRAINGFIPKETLSQNIFTIAIRTRVGHTYGVSDSQRYKCCGNAVTTNVIKDIMVHLL